MTTILIIDDDPGIQEVLKIIFERAGYRVIIKSNADGIFEDAYLLPDVFLLDRYLSGMDGLDVCRHLKASTYSSHIPVIMISATPDFAPLAISAGADDFIEKPFNIKDLIKIIEKHTVRQI